MQQGSTLTRYAVAVGILVGAALPAAAVDRTRTISFNGDWDSGSSWTPFGVPTISDRAFIDTDQDVFLLRDIATVGGLFISNSGEVRTSGFRLPVLNIAQTAVTSITGDGSRVRVTPHTTSTTSFVTNFLDINSGGRLDMVGGLAEVDVDLDIATGGLLVGHGTVHLSGSQNNKLFNNGTIRALSGDLRIISTGGGTFDLDGSGSGVLEAVDGTGFLVIDGDTSLDDFSSTLNVGAGRTVRFIQAWVTDTSADINFNTLGALGAIDGALLTHGGTTNVNAGNARFGGPVTFSSTGTVNINAGTTLQLSDDTTVEAGATFAGDGPLLNLSVGTLTARDNATIGVMLENHGTLLIGSSPGEVETQGFAQVSTGVLQIELAGTGGGDFDVLTVQNNATLDGTLDVDLLGGFTPVLGHSFTVLETVLGNVSGTFDTVNVPIFNGLTLDAVYHAKSVVLEVVSAAATGDYNDSGLVEQGDLDLVLSNWGAGFAGLPGTWVNQRPTSGIVDQAELDVVLSNWGNTSAPDFRGTDVPEPVGAGALLVLVASARARRRRCPPNDQHLETTAGA